MRSLKYFCRVQDGLYCTEHINTSLSYYIQMLSNATGQNHKIVEIFQ